MQTISIENVWKEYRLGVIDHGTLFQDLQSAWARLRGATDPNAPIISEDHSNIVDGKILQALRGVNIEVRQGEVLGIVGKNGAGKSTLLKILSRITTPSRGQIKIRGRIASLLEVGTGFHPELTGRENIYLNGSIMGMSRAEVEANFDEIVAFAGLERFIDTPVKRYSSGMYVRLGFAVAAHLEPEILVVDEVLAVGDAEFQKKCIGKMKEVSTEGRTVLFVSHNMHSVKSLCDRAVWLDRGAICADGRADEITDTYLKSMQNQSGFEAERGPFYSEIGKHVKKQGRHGNGEFQFTHWEIVDSKFNVRNTFYYNDSIHLRLQCKAFVELEDVIFHYTLQDAASGVAITSANHTFTDRIEVGSGFGIHLKIPEYIVRPVRYYRFQIALLTMRGLDLDVLSDYGLDFEVSLDPDFSIEYPFSRNSPSGYVTAPIKVDINRAQV